MTALERAERVVRTARTRLMWSGAFAASARGALAGAAAGLAAAAAARWGFGVSPGPALLLAPVAGAALAALWTSRRAPGLDIAALALDRAARTDEAFVSALAAPQAEMEFRSLSAEYALGRCDGRDVRRVLPIQTPAAAAAAVLATCALAALVLVPGRTAAELTDEMPEERVPVAATAAAPEAREVSPAQRTGDMVTALRAGDAAAAERLAPQVRGDLAAVSDEDLRAVARALAEGGSADARDAITALERGDRGAAIAALRRALGFRPADAGAELAGGAGAGAVPGDDAGAPPVERTAANWPLRYDRTIRKWLEERR